MNENIVLAEKQINELRNVNKKNSYGPNEAECIKKNPDNYILALYDSRKKSYANNIKGDSFNQNNFLKNNANEQILLNHKQPSNFGNNISNKDFKKNINTGNNKSNNFNIKKKGSMPSSIELKNLQISSNGNNNVYSKQHSSNANLVNKNNIASSGNNKGLISQVQIRKINLIQMEKNKQDSCNNLINLNIKNNIPEPNNEENQRIHNFIPNYNIQVNRLKEARSSVSRSPKYRNFSNNLQNINLNYNNNNNNPAAVNKNFNLNIIPHRDKVAEEKEREKDLNALLHENKNKFTELDKRLENQLNEGIINLNLNDIRNININNNNNCNNLVSKKAKDSKIKNRKKFKNHSSDSNASAKLGFGFQKFPFFNHKGVFKYKFNPNKKIHKTDSANKILAENIEPNNSINLSSSDEQTENNENNPNNNDNYFKKNYHNNNFEVEKNCTELDLLHNLDKNFENLNKKKTKAMIQQSINNINELQLNCQSKAEKENTNDYNFNKINNIFLNNYDLASKGRINLQNEMSNLNNLSEISEIFSSNNDNRLRTSENNIKLLSINKSWNINNNSQTDDLTLVLSPKGFDPAVSINNNVEFKSNFFIEKNKNKSYSPDNTRANLPNNNNKAKNISVINPNKLVTNPNNFILNTIESNRPAAAAGDANNLLASQIANQNSLQANRINTINIQKFLNTGNANTNNNNNNSNLNENYFPNAKNKSNEINNLALSSQRSNISSNTNTNNTNINMNIYTNDQLSENYNINNNNNNNLKQMKFTANIYELNENINNVVRKISNISSRDREPRHIEDNNFGNFNNANFGIRSNNAHSNNNGNSHQRTRSTDKQINLLQLARLERQQNKKLDSVNSNNELNDMLNRNISLNRDNKVKTLESYCLLSDLKRERENNNIINNNHHSPSPNPINSSIDAAKLEAKGFNKHTVEFFNDYKKSKNNTNFKSHELNDNLLTSQNNTNFHNYIVNEKDMLTEAFGINNINSNLYSYNESNNENLNTDNTQRGLTNFASNNLNNHDRKLNPYNNDINSHFRKINETNHKLFGLDIVNEGSLDIVEESKLTIDEDVVKHLNYQKNPKLINSIEK